MDPGRRDDRLGSVDSVPEDDAVLVDLAVQRVAADAERLRRAADVPTHALELAQQRRAFGLAQGRCRAG